MGIDCRYCHNTVERTAFAALPATQTCMNCHTQIKTDSPQLLAIRQSWADNAPVLTSNYYLSGDATVDASCFQVGTAASATVSARIEGAGPVGL